MLLIAPPTSYRVGAYARAAASLGAELVVASQGEHSLTPEIARGIHVDLDDVDGAVAAILAAVAARPPAAVVATDDSTVELASLAARGLGLPHNPVAATRISRRKDLARAALAAAGVPVPAFRRVDLAAPLPAQLAGLDYPCVVKPLAMSASRGVIRADDPDGLAAACERVGRIVAGARDADERRYLLVEAFVPGPEVAVEGMLRDGALSVLAVFDKPDPLDGPYFEETYYVTPSRLPAAALARLERRVAEACAAYGLVDGPVHAELRLGGGEAWVLEVAARTIGGDCARLLRFGTGHGLEELVLGHALRAPLDLRAAADAAGVLMIPVPRAGTLRRVEGVLAALAVPGVEDVVIAVREGYELTPVPEGAGYLGFVFARGPDPESVERALRAAHGCLEVVVAPVWRLEPGALAPAPA